MPSLEVGSMTISIHALHEESDCTVEPQYKFSFLFQSTLSMRRATCLIHAIGQTHIVISIHALHEESDRTRAVDGNDTANFNPRSP